MICRKISLLAILTVGLIVESSIDASGLSTTIYQNTNKHTLAALGLACATTGALLYAIQCYNKQSTIKKDAEKKNRQNYTWLMANYSTVPTIFYQRMGSSQTQCAKYTGAHGFIATTGEHIACTKSIDTIHHAYIGTEIAEVVPKQPFARLWHNRLNPVNFCSALYHSLYQTMAQRANRAYGITSGNPSRSESILGHSVYLSHINIGQEKDMASHNAKYQKLVKMYGEGYPKIAYGVSRGAATTFKSVAAHNYKNIKLVVLEGCPDDIDTVIKTRHPWLYACGGVILFYSLMEHISSYKRNGGQPLDFVEKFPKDVPVIFISSLKDTEVPYACTQRLAQALKNSGHPEVYFLTLKNSSHPRYTMDDIDDMNAYERTIHALYKKLGLPYIAGLADKGKELLDQSHL